MSACEVCGGPCTDLPLGGSVLDACTRCGHLRRDLDRAPARHRDHAYGGDPTLDAARLRLTHRALVADGAPASVFEIGYGAGGLLRAFHDAGARVAGADPDQLDRDVDPVVVAHGRLHACGIEEVPAGAPPVDLVYGIHVLLSLIHI